LSLVDNNDNNNYNDTSATTTTTTIKWAELSAPMRSMRLRSQSNERKWQMFAQMSVVNYA